MLLRFAKQQKSPKKVDEARDIADDVTEADFIPYAFHYDTHTLLTKNGELLQILRIVSNASGTDYESSEPDQRSLRDAIRHAINESVESRRFAYWFHTIRRKHPIHFDSKFDEPFAAEMNKAWQDKNRWQFSYSNEVFITILHEGQAADLLDMKDMGRGLLPTQNRKSREAFVQQVKTELDAASARITESLSKHASVQRLAMVEREHEGKRALFSEPLEMLHYLVNLHRGPVAVSTVDASRQLATSELTFGFDAMESRAPDGSRRFAGMLTLKGAPELSPQVLDKCLQLPEELIITQSFNYMPAKQALEKRVEIKEMIESNPDPLIPNISGLSALLAGDRGKPTDFGEQHTSIAIIRDQYKQLDAGIGEVQESFAKLGLISVREELMLEDCYWAQLPGNFNFLRRRTPVSAARMAGLARLNHFPSGSPKGSIWGPPVAILPTTLGTPYFFNFHQGNIGHSVLLDFNSFADECGTSILNFLLTCSRQYEGRLIVIDRNRTSVPLVEALGGKYYHPAGEDRGSETCSLNPLALDDTPRNRAFLVSWLMHSVRKDYAEKEAMAEILKLVLEPLFALPKEQRTLRKVRSLIAEVNPDLLEDNELILAPLFGDVEDTLDFSHKVCAVEMLDATKDKQNIIPLFSYLLHRIALSLDGRPTIIVLNEAWHLLDNDFFMPRLASLLSMLQQNNALVVFATRRFDDHADSYLTQQIMKLVPTRIFVPDDVLADYYPEATGLTPREVKVLTRMERQKGQFMLKHGQEVVECVFPVDGLDRYAKILAGDAQALRLMQIQQR